MIMVVVPQAGDLNSKFTQWIVDASLYYMFVYDTNWRLLWTFLYSH